MLQKLMSNQACENMGFATTQMLATLSDGIARHTTEGRAFKAPAAQVGFTRGVRTYCPLNSAGVRVRNAFWPMSQSSERQR